MSAPARACAVVDAQPPADGIPLRGELQALVASAMSAAAIPDVSVLPSVAPERLVLVFGPDTSGQTVAGAFLDALGSLLTSRDAGRDRADRLRIAVTLGRAVAGEPGLPVLRVADAPVLARVRAGNPAPVVAMTEAWLDQMPRPGGGLSHVRSDADTFWISVPGRALPWGLTPRDSALESRADPVRDQDRRSAGTTMTATTFGDHYGDVVGRDKIVGGNATIHYGPSNGAGS